MCSFFTTFGKEGVRSVILFLFFDLSCLGGMWPYVQSQRPRMADARDIPAQNYCRTGVITGFFPMDSTCNFLCLVIHYFNTLNYCTWLL